MRARSRSSPWSRFSGFGSPKLVALAFFVGGLFGAGSGRAEPGDLYVKATTRTLVGEAAFGPDGATLDLPESFQDHQVRLWGAYALDDAWTVFARLTPVGLGVYADDTTTYFGGGAVGAAFRFFGGPLSLSVEAEIGGRPGSSVLFSGVVEGVPVRVTPVLGTAHAGARLVAVQGFRWGWLRAHAGGVGFTSSRLDPALEGFLQAGFRLADTLLLDIHLSGWFAFGDLAPVEVIGSGQTRYLGLGAGVEWWAFGNAALTAGLDVGPIAEANAVSPSLVFGVAFRGG